MNLYLSIAAILCFILGLVHSFLGEYLIFRNLKIKKGVELLAGSFELKKRHLRILRATWHLATVFGCCMGAILLKITSAERPLNSELTVFILESIGITMIISSLLVLIGTKGKHPGWVVLLAIGILTIYGI